MTTLRMTSTTTRVKRRGRSGEKVFKNSRKKKRRYSKIQIVSTYTKERG